jgi:membrane-bound serine protease (ClpP class)
MNRSTVLAALADPNRAWITLVVGLLLIYRECLAPGRVLPGVFGGVAVTVALYSLLQHPWRGEAVAMIAGGLVLIFVQAVRRWFWLPSILAAILLTLGAHRLTEPPIAFLLAAAAVPLSGITVFLLRTAVRARRNKASIQ